jgi:RNA polymerase sigma factor (sigma-70 family)
MTINEEIEILNQIKNSNFDVLKKLYLELYPIALAWAKRLFPLTSDSEILDSFHTTLLILVQNILTGKLTKLEGNIKTYIFAILRNQLLKAKAINENMTSINIETDYSFNKPSNEFDEELFNIINNAIINVLTEEEQIILRMSMQSNISIYDIAKTLNMSEKSIFTIKRRAIEKLQKHIKLKKPNIFYE